MNARETSRDEGADGSPGVRSEPCGGEDPWCLGLSGDEYGLVARAAASAGTPPDVWARWVIVSAARRRIADAGRALETEPR